MQNGRVSVGTSSLWSKRAKRLAIAVAATVLSFGTVHSAKAEFFDWLSEPTRPAGAGYVTTPTLTDATADAVAAYLATAKAAGQTLAVKVPAGTTLSAATIQKIYGTYNVQYTFGDYEGPSTVAQLTTLVNQIKGSAVTGPAFSAGTSFVGNYGVAPMPSDPTAPGPVYKTGNSNASSSSNLADFRNTGVNMSSESLYPGDASFRNPVFGKSPASGGTNPAGSDAPNIRSALFTLPIQRLTIASQNLNPGANHTPFVTRFNNYTNPGLQNSGNTFNTAGPSINGQAVAQQLLSRDDFQALVLHYEMRGADGYHLLDGGVVGYTQQQFENDARYGWTGDTSIIGDGHDNNASLVLGVLHGTNGRPANFGTTITVDGALQTFENSGVAWSAVTNDNASGPQLAILLSNLSGADHQVKFNTRINGATLSFTTGVTAGTHQILRFTKTGTTWGAAIVSSAFDDAALSSRDGIGIPEPASLSLLGLGALGVLVRRRRRA